MDDSDPHHEHRYWLALLHLPGLGSRGLSRLLALEPEPRRILKQPDHCTRSLTGGEKIAEACRNPRWDLVERDLAWLEQPGRHLITCQDPRYPPLLLDIDDPPPLLFVQGDPDLLSTPQLAMVGSRNPTTSGRRTAYDFARHLAQAGLCITSGLALGIDAASHQGALEVGGTTVAVTGTGLDRVYPASHRELAHEIAARGALVSEFPPGTPPRAGHFPRRNRIISGLSVGTLVVEAAIQSGSLITARSAAEQGREVFAIPGSIHNPLVRGCHNLIRQGAKLVENGSDVIEELGALLGHVAQSGEAPADRAPPPEWDADYACLIEQLGYDPVTVDTLIERSGLTAEAVSSMLILLELEGFVASAHGGRYVRTDKLM